MTVKSTKESAVASGGIDAAETPNCNGDGKDIDPNEKHLGTDHLRTNLKHRTISSGIVTLTSQGAKFAINLASTVILARLLAPRDFGLLAMVWAFVSVLRMFKDAGLSTATVQREGITQAQVSNLFWINVAVSGALALILAASAPVIAWFYGEPHLIAMTIWLSTTFLLNGSTVQHQALMQRQMRFVPLAVIEVGSMAASLLAGVLMAWWGCGYWSLVGMNLAREGVAFALTWSLSTWRPQWPRRHSGTRSLLSFGVNMTAGSALYVFSRGVDSVLIGRCYGADSVGLYSRALALLMRPLDQFLLPVGSVFMPTLSRLQGQPERYRRVFLDLYKGMAWVGFILGGLFLPLSRPVTLVLLGPKWESAAVIFRCFAIAAFYAPVASTVTWLLVSQGRSKDFLRWNSITALITVLSFVVGLPFGPAGVALAFSIVGLLVVMPVQYHLVGSSGPVSAKDLWLEFFRQSPLGFSVLGATCLAHNWAAKFSPLTQLLICVPIGISAGAASMLVFKPQRDIAFHIFESTRGMLSARLKLAAK